MKIKNIFKTLALTVVASMTLASCSGWGDYEPEMIPGNQLAGEWYVTYKVGGVDIYGLGYNTLLTATTAAADGKELLIDDQGHFWTFKVKSPMNVDAQTFGNGNDSLINLIEGYEIGVWVRSGKVITNGGKSKTGVEVDSIYMEVEFADDPGTIYEISGHGRTGFEEDDF